MPRRTGYPACAGYDDRLPSDTVATRRAETTLRDCGGPRQPATHRANNNIIPGARMNFSHLFSPLQVGPYPLAHRVVLAPLTRMRAAKPSLAPRPLNAEYYAQRATA